MVRLNNLIASRAELSAVALMTTAVLVVNSLLYYALTVARHTIILLVIICNNKEDIPFLGDRMAIVMIASGASCILDLIVVLLGWFLRRKYLSFGWGMVGAGVAVMACKILWRILTE